MRNHELDGSAMMIRMWSVSKASGAMVGTMSTSKQTLCPCTNSKLLGTTARCAAAHRSAAQELWNAEA